MTDDKFTKALTEFINEWVENGEFISVGNLYGAATPTITVCINNLNAEKSEDGQCIVVRPERK